MHLYLIDYGLWFSAPILQLGILRAMYARGLHRRYPWFALYTLLQVLTEPVLFVLLRSSYTAYYYGYWVVILISTLLSAAVIYEVARTPFRGDVAPPGGPLSGSWRSSP